MTAASSSNAAVIRAHERVAQMTADDRAVFTRAFEDVWHGKKNVAKRMLKFFAKGEKSAGTALTRMLLSVQAHAIVKRVNVSEAFVIKLVERLDQLLRARHVSRFATFVDAIGEAEAGDDFDILGLRKDGAAFARLSVDSSAPAATRWRYTPTRSRPARQRQRSSSR